MNIDADHTPTIILTKWGPGEGATRADRFLCESGDRNRWLYHLVALTICRTKPVYLARCHHVNAVHPSSSPKWILHMKFMRRPAGRRWVVMGVLMGSVHKQFLRARAGAHAPLNSQETPMYLGTARPGLLSNACFHWGSTVKLHLYCCGACSRSDGQSCYAAQLWAGRWSRRQWCVWHLSQQQHQAQKPTRTPLSSMAHLLRALPDHLPREPLVTVVQYGGEGRAWLKQLSLYCSGRGRVAQMDHTPLSH